MKESSVDGVICYIGMINACTTTRSCACALTVGYGDSCPVSGWEATGRKNLDDYLWFWQRSGDHIRDLDKNVSHEWSVTITHWCVEEKTSKTYERGWVKDNNNHHDHDWKGINRWTIANGTGPDHLCLDLLFKHQQLITSGQTTALLLRLIDGVDREVWV